MIYTIKVENNWKFFSSILGPPYPLCRIYPSGPREMRGVETHKNCELGDGSEALYFFHRDLLRTRDGTHISSPKRFLLPSFSFSVVPLPSRAICFDAAMSGPLTHRTVDGIGAAVASWLRRGCGCRHRPACLSIGRRHD